MASGMSDGAPASVHRASRTIPFTPGRGVTSRSAAHVSAKEYDRYLRRLSAVQSSTRKAMQTANVSPDGEEDASGVNASGASSEAALRADGESTPQPTSAAHAVHASYLHEASFVQNPLSERVPNMSPRKLAQPRVYDMLGAGVSKKEAVRDIPLRSVDRQLQDVLLVEDLLFVLIGIEGNYVQFSPQYKPDDLGHRLNGAQFVIDAELNGSLREMVERILPLASYYTSIHAFVERDAGLEYGTVMHALCAAIRTQLHAYEGLVEQMEQRLLRSPDFTLQQLWRTMHPMLRTFALIHSLTSEIASITHADVLPRTEEEAADESSEGESSLTYGSDAFQLERDRRALLGLDSGAAEDIHGGIVKGGEVLSILWDRLVHLGGDPDAHALFLELFREASQPYARTLLRWITSGQLLDPYEECMVVEDKRVTQASLEVDPTDEYWERRYMLRDERVLEQKDLEEQQRAMEGGANEPELNLRGDLTGGAKIPAFLEAWKHKILSAGKYLNAIRECGIDVSDVHSSRAGSLFGEQDAHVATTLEKEANQERIHMDSDEFIVCIENAYQRANAALLRLLVQDKDIIARLCSLKHYFFFSRTDFLQAFLDQSSHELRKMVDPQRIRETTLLRLQTQLDMVLGSSDTVGFHDPYREELRVDLAKERAYDQLQRIADTKGVVEIAKLRAKQQAERHKAGARELAMYLLQFDVHVQFPVSLVISKKNVLRWQFIHRCLLLLKLLERGLSEVWPEQTDKEWRALDRRRHGDVLQRWKLRVHLLRQRMLLLVQQLLAFYTTEIIQPNWRELEQKLREARSVEIFMKHHFDFLNTCRKECMLTDYRYLECHRKLMNTITVFTESRARFQEHLRHMTKALDAWHAAPHDTEFPAFPAHDPLAKIEASWNKHARTFRDVVNLLSTTENPAALPLAYRLQTALR
ncbi:gamma tubulin complex Spc97/GCP2 subunit Alp4 [Malassezia vespertilionis]|uniref:Spindle pole body component n=1 Tax=Malassezia vespertilionis TaxID=2020962 RepID=A0A2N1JBA1_9BASI|nr:gamma tubulin complex Spc97/GCP2 subunit Alp4 [Malassezia vespertilionis]PKI83815.1 hypothetical protein MVES_002289 [Malassezia vespertilionis]WFD07065.1 gamma tubulin complex Spc97/GCP2 subunit Alp4 [Malassezia vespertilionis]